MNTFIGSGRLIDNAIVCGRETKALHFIVAARHGYDAANKRAATELVPCVMFGASQAQIDFFCNHGGGMEIEFRGRVATSHYRQASGRRRYSTEIVVDNPTLNILRR